MQIDPQQNQRNAQARAVALGSLSELAIDATALIQFASRGHVLVIGNMDAMDVAHRLRQPLHARVLLTEGAEEPGVPVVHQGGRRLQVSGHLGAFEVQLGEPGKPNAETLHADLIVDMSPTPVFAMPLPPLGYVHVSMEDADLDNTLDALGDMVGTFEKPKFFHYDAAKCAHGRNGKIACTNCIDACPTDAISSLMDKIEVNPNLCQGGGVCATVCPSGAIRYAYPGARDTLEQIKTLLRSYREQGGEAPVLALFSEGEWEAAGGELPANTPGNVLPVILEELASVGLDVWLSALAYGVQTIHLVDAGDISERVREALQFQRETANRLLEAMGYPADLIRLISPQQLGTASDVALLLAKTASFQTHNDKRETAYLAIDHLYAQAEHAKPMVLLAAGAPFGNAELNEAACTLCMACVSACPGKALQAGQDSPVLRFVEANCLQCGLCTRTCPENAITLSPRLVFDAEQRRAPRVLKEEPPFHCVECGKPFATRSVITTMLGKLQGHAMFQSERAKRRLMLCDDCRVADVVQDPEAMSQGIDGQFRQ